MAKESFCMDIGGTKIKYAFVSKNNIKDYSEIVTPKSEDKLLLLIKELIESNANKVKSNCISIASPIADGVIKNPPNLPLHNFNLKAYLKKATKSRIFIENDVRCVALAEHKFGVKKENFVVLSLGTGIGGGIFISGKLYSGKGIAGELGHIIIKGKYLEDLWKETRQDIKRKNNWKLLTVNELLESNEEKFRKIKERMLDYLAQAIVTITNSLDPECIILSGGIKFTSSSLIPALSDYIKKYSFKEAPTPLCWSSLEHPELIGAGLLSAG